MAVSTEHTKDILMGDGVNTKFPFTFQVIEKAQIHCLKVLASGEEIELLNTEFEIKLNDNGGGEVTYPLVGDPLDEGCKFIIYRKTEIKQDYTPANSTTFSAESIKNEIDRLTMQNQEQEESLERCVQTTMGSEADPSEYLENVNEMLANARELQEKAVSDSKQNIADAKKQVDIATEKAADAALSEKNAAESAQSAADAVNGFDAHVLEKKTEFDANAQEKTEAFDKNANIKQTAVDNSAANAEYWAKEAQKIYNRTDIQSQSIYQERVILDSPVIVLQERKCRYFRNVASGDAFTIDISNVKQTDRDITVDLILNMPSVVPFSLAAIVPSASKWLGEKPLTFLKPANIGLLLFHRTAALPGAALMKGYLYHDNQNSIQAPRRRASY